MDKIEHKNVSVNGINMHIAELGEGPLVLFLHGFPELWYSWRHQILFLASHGYRAVAPDLRGYGDTTGAPVNDSSKFSPLHIVGDLIALTQAIAPDQEKVFVVGHDWGAFIAWHLCLFRPDKVRALVNLSVAFFPRNPSCSLVESLRSAYGDDYYVCRFQNLGTYCTLDWGSSKSSNQVCYWGARFDLPYARSARIYTQGWLQERCAFVGGSCCSERCSSLYQPRKA
ncbi:epoxide hydrolase 3-like isoform X3 [Coffea arabica]|uniref:Epoxide hydrolase 3-like isoform X3 n=1 Tax=Coffea arabica TaxID=13443 RepID=A0A6P6XJX4_COFAR|nr:uncharacterized protein LOC113743459 isoform X3 [Coffea arabica]